MTLETRKRLNLPPESVHPPWNRGVATGTTINPRDVAVDIMPLEPSMRSPRNSNRVKREEEKEEQKVRFKNLR
jgi:hypothetical protein